VAKKAWIRRLYGGRGNGKCEGRKYEGSRDTAAGCELAREYRRIGRQDETSELSETKDNVSLMGERGIGWGSIFRWPVDVEGMGWVRVRTGTQDHL
jgi:hypothetical protein